MSARPPPSTAPVGLRLEILKELQQLIENRDARDRLEKSPLGEAKGREHWVLHLLVRAQEFEQSHFDTLIGTAYSNLLARLQSVEDRIARVEESHSAATTDVRERIDALSTSFGERVDQGIDRGVDKISREVTQRMGQSLDQKWKPVGESIETFAIGSRQVLKDVADTYRVATQTRLLLNENARRITDLGRDLLALEDSLKLVVTKAIEDGLAPLEQRLAALESHNGLSPAAPREGLEKPASATSANGS
jgi:hypothetical protein